MLTILNQANATVFSPDRGTADNAACQRARRVYGGYYGPWIDVDGVVLDDPTTRSPNLPNHLGQDEEEIDEI